MFSRKPKPEAELKAVEVQISAKEGKVSQLKVSLRDTRAKFEAIAKEISAAETEREDILDKFVAGEATQIDLDKVRKHFDELVLKEVDLTDIIKTTEAVISRTENEILSLQNQKPSLERTVWQGAADELKSELRKVAKPLVLQGLAAARRLGIPLVAGVTHGLFFDTLADPVELNRAESEVIKKYF